MRFLREIRLGLGLGLATAGMAQTGSIPEAEALQPPTASRLAAILSAAQRGSWGAQSTMLRSAALRAYEKDRTAAAEAWLNVYRWATLFARPEEDFTREWFGALQAANVAHPNMPRRYDVHPRPLGAGLLPELQSWLIGNGAFSQEFFALLSPVDYVPEVFRILGTLHHRDPSPFKKYASLALAIALVYDVPPPPSWPHGQVSIEALPRQLPPPADAFAWFVQQERLGRLHQRLTQLGAAELKFVVDVTAPFTELEWAQRVVDLPSTALERAYTMVRYRTDRMTSNQPIWPGAKYRLPDILAAGGICVDQAYFATQVGKARGMPTLLFAGAGNDGRHAWVGYLDRREKWRLDVGRTGAQRFVTGLARDPQTWGLISDHELQFLSDGFRGRPAYRQSQVHVNFSALYLALGNGPAAGVAARKAVNYERRNQAGWEALIGAARKEGRPPRTIENLFREAVIAFRRYPDLEAYYVSRVAESLRARGETSAADEEIRAIALKNKGSRTDLSVQQAREILQRAIASQPEPEQMRSYNAVVDRYGPGAGIAFFDAVVAPFVEHLLELKQKSDARRALERARQALKVESGSQLHAELERLAQSIRSK